MVLFLRPSQWKATLNPHITSGVFFPSFSVFPPLSPSPLLVPPISPFKPFFLGRWGVIHSLASFIFRQTTTSVFPHRKGILSVLNNSQCVFWGERMWGRHTCSRILNIYHFFCCVFSFVAPMQYSNHSPYRKTKQQKHSISKRSN